jgi:steroid delta-isomerase-like uncharacterized protein
VGIEREEEHMTRNTRIATLGGPAILIVMLALVLACQPQPSSGLSQEEATAFINQVAEMWNSKDLDMLDELYAPDVLWHHVEFAEDSIGLDAAREFGTVALAAFPDLDTVLDEILVDGDKIVLRFTQTGTNTGSWAGNPPTGRTVKVSGVAIYQLADGKVVEQWDHLNELSLMRQLGYTLAPPAMEEEATD